MSDRGEPSEAADASPADRAPDGDEGDRPTGGGQAADGERTVEEATIDPAVAATAREELRTTFDYQVERLREIDNKAIEILKANLLLIGIVVTGGSIVVQTELDLAVFLNPFTVVGGLLLLASTGLAAVTYTASDLRGGLDIRAIDAVIASERTESATADTDDGADPGFDERLLRSYAEWIDYNARVTAVNDLLATATVLLIFVAFVYVIAGVVVGAANLTAVESWASFAVLTAFVAVFTWLSAHMDHLGPETTHPAASFAGIPLSKGADRRQALSSLRAMLGRAPPEESNETDGTDGDDGAV
ncbi:hypothetical protein C461_06074 [Halorubrum aidingense JCM 13560]|uniref:Uncharacterized protein n=1 Tax=Halorubrum aidingense JCM 13560 TaxID=1230454 RepID=M0PH84_9EURY|nr:hypothetical protein [Halorubrum aidingense]EMA68125.1 hypothetical protein C461_06074 [Halorubrum aidingense JCM 13560]